MLWLALVLMAAITFCCRYAFFSSRLRFRLHYKLQRLLDYAAPAVMTAMWVPIVFGSSEGQFDLDLHSPFLWGGVASVLLSLVLRHTLLVVIFSMVAFFILKAYLV